MAFYEAFFQTQKLFALDWKRQKRYYKLPGYEVLELLTDEQGLYGFSMHFSNGSKATFARQKDKVVAENLDFSGEGIGFQVGDLGGLTTKWLVDGKEFSDSP
jgi:hypothetical protein